MGFSSFFQGFRGFDREGKSLVNLGVFLENQKNQGKEGRGRHINSREILRTPAGCPLNKQATKHRLLTLGPWRLSRRLACSLPAECGCGRPGLQHELRRRAACLPDEIAGSLFCSQKSGKETLEKKGRKVAEQKFPNCLNFRPEFYPEFCSEVSRIFRGVFVLRFVGNGDQKNFTKDPRHFSMQNSRANTKKKFTKSLWGAGKVRHWKKGASCPILMLILQIFKDRSWQCGFCPRNS